MFSYQRGTSVKPFVDYDAPVGLADVVREQLGVSQDTAAASIKVLCVLSQYENRMEVLRDEIKSLESQMMCSGSLEVRNSGTILAIHSIRCPCSYPGHDGQTKNGRGIRRYVRKGDEEELRAAQARYGQHERLSRELDVLLHSYQGLLRQLNETAELADCAVLKN